MTRRPTPARITLALDAPAAPGADGPLYGPGVDEFCGVPEPTVDQWETGELTPTDSQLQRLAELTGYPVAFFYQPPPPPMRGWICQRSGRGKGCTFFDTSTPPEAGQMSLPGMP